jgi:hypothetical protein
MEFVTEGALSSMILDISLIFYFVSHFLFTVTHLMIILALCFHIKFQLLSDSLLV